MGRVKPKAAGRVKPKAADAGSGAPLASATAYLHLLKKTLLRFPLTDDDRAMRAEITGVGEDRLREIDRWLDASRDPGDECPDPETRAAGRDWPSTAETMIGLFRMDNLHASLLDVIQRGVPGDVIEAGVWRGGAAIFMRAVLVACGESARQVWVADSFEGLPRPDPERYPADAGDTHWQQPALAVSLAEVKANFRRYGLLDRRVRFLAGWFRDTLPASRIDRLALMRVDADMYESTIVALEALYPKLSRGGLVIVDDYGALETCRRAVDDFRRPRSIADPLLPIDWTGITWQAT